MANWNGFTRFHRWVYQQSGGRLMKRLAGLDMALLTTRGRRSGEPRTAPLACFRDGDDLIVVASNNGQDHHPAWWLNLEAHPEASVQLGPERWAVRAVRAEGEERARLWKRAVEANPMYARYEQRTGRAIPVVALRRSPGA